MIKPKRQYASSSAKRYDLAKNESVSWNWMAYLDPNLALKTAAKTAFAIRTGRYLIANRPHFPVGDGRNLGLAASAIWTSILDFLSPTAGDTFAGEDIGRLQELMDYADII
jgi:hypothetical protein